MPVFQAGKNLNANPKTLDGAAFGPENLKTDCRQPRCEGLVMISRDPETLQLKLNDARCLYCGQAYKIENAPKWWK